MAGLTGKTYEFRNGDVREFLGDVEYFLQKRAESDMRAIEMRDAPADEETSALKPKKPALSYAEKKALKNKVNSKEREIEKLEKLITRCEEKMLAPDFYESPEAAKILKDHNSFLESMEVKMEEWEELTLLLEEENV